MSDIVDELWLIGCHENGEARCTCGVGMDAADEITRLRAENAALERRIDEEAARKLNAEAELAKALERVAALTRERDALREALERIEQWGRAYPLSVFPEPDFAKAREALEAAGLTLDAVSASNMRYIVEGVSEIARAALKGAPNE